MSWMYWLPSTERLKSMKVTPTLVSRVSSSSSPSVSNTTRSISEASRSESSRL